MFGYSIPFSVSESPGMMMVLVDGVKSSGCDDDVADDEDDGDEGDGEETEQQTH